MKIGIIGTRGIPNHYGGFEQAAQYLSKGLAAKGHEVLVYNSHNHLYSEKKWKGVHIVHCYDPEYRLGTAGQFIYDLNCINDSRKRDFDILLHFGYTSDSIWWRRWPKKTIHIVNMDGLEWKRSKYSKPTQLFLKRAESLAAKKAQLLVADSPGIQEYLLKKYEKDVVYIPYGAKIFENPDPAFLNSFGLQPYLYYLLIARIEPENNIETVITGYIASGQQSPLLVVGDASNKYGKFLKEKYGDRRIIFTGAIYDTPVINNLRYYSGLYFHGHSVGGTNPSLLEAMACSCTIVAHDNIFNKTVLQDDAVFFSTGSDVTTILNSALKEEEVIYSRKANLKKIESLYNWQKIIDSYEEVMLSAIDSRL